MRPPARSPKVLHTNNSLPSFCSHCYELSNDDFYPDMNIHTEFGDLTPNQMLSTFTTFRAMPEFEQSSFQALMEMTLMKQSASEESINEIEQPPEEIEVGEREKK